MKSQSQEIIASIVTLIRMISPLTILFDYIKYDHGILPDQAAFNR